jgi:hypothetical protein
MADKDLTHSESLEIITKMINQVKNNYYESGMGALLWGFTNLICFTLAYLDAKHWIVMPFSPFLLMIITFVLQYYFDRKESRFKTATTYIDEVHKYIWASFGAAVLIVSIVGGLAQLHYWTLPILLLLFGMPTFSSGCIMKFRPFIIGGILCWFLSIAAFFYKNYNSYLLVAAGATVAWIIPGFILRARFIKNRIKNSDGV